MGREMAVTKGNALSVSATGRVPYGSQSDRRERAKAATRSRLLEATCEALLKSVRGDIRVEDIVSVADVSRATFYLHFSSIDAALSAVRAEMIGRLDAEYDRLASLRHAGFADIRDWLVAMLAMCRRHRSMVLALMRSSGLPGASFDARGYYDGVIARLAVTRPAFRQACGDSAARADALLLLFQIEGVIRYFVAAQGGDEEALMVDRIADGLSRFIARGVDAANLNQAGREY